ncbi:MAG: substrate-binding domain-containing protein [Prevotella sp.]|nr:substrate-binding domain-containing protein [Prevotella sp.]
MRRNILYLIILIALLTACSGNQAEYRIAVSQCSEGNWRSKLNNEMLAAQHLYEHDVEVSITNCHDNSALQIRQIDSLADEGIDLLVVAPNEYAPIAEAVARTRKKGIPVVFFDRKTDTEDQTAFIGGDNVATGRMSGVYALELAHRMLRQQPARKPVVLEITALLQTSPARDRHDGFSQAMQGHDEVEYVCINGDWDDNNTARIVKEQLESSQQPDIIFCHSDFMASGAYRAAKELGMEQQVKILGVDGLPGEGIEAVRKGEFAGTCVYPTHGEQIVRLALDILTGKPYQQVNYLQGMMITPENVEMVALYTDEQQRQYDDMIVVQGKLEEYFGLYNVQSKVIAVCACAILLLAVAVLMSWLARRRMREANRRIRQAHDEQTAFYTNARHQLRTPLTLVAGPVRQFLEKYTLKEDQRELMEIIDRNVARLETVVTSVLDFKMGDGQPAIDDANANQALQQTASMADALQEGRLALMKQEDSDELATILIVDDNDDMRHYLRTLLADKFYVLEAADGQGGLRLARECVPDLVVSDVMMPVMDGLQFCKQLKEDAITCHIPVILLTARSTEQQQTEGYEHGADAYLTKPFSTSLLIARIYNLLKNRKQLRHMADGQHDETPVQLSTQDKLFADALKDVFMKNLSNPDLRIDELGEMLGLGRVQLYRKVKALTGISPVELLREMRLQRSYNLINSTTKSISEIAYEVGFHTPSYFSNCFKKQFGKYPTELRAE